MFSQGEKFENIFAVASGSAKSIVQSPDGSARISNLILRGDIVGFSGVESGVHVSTLIALEGTTFCVIPYQRLMQYMQADRLISLQFHRLVTRVVLQRQAVRLLCSGSSAERRVGGFLVWYVEQLTARQQYATDFSLPLTRGDLADFIGLRQETVSRAFARLAKLRLIEIHGRDIRVPDIEKLRSYLPLPAAQAE